QMAERGQLVTIGSGDKKTNPIFEGDLAKVCVNSIREKNAIIEAGGKYTYTRKQLNEVVQNEVNPEKKTRNIRIGFLKFLLPIVKLFNRNMYDKMAFFLEVIQHDTIAPALGVMRFEDYVKLKYQEMKSHQ
ncbi:MAG: SDR family NAD(P)-dependent oxidoreductase, partial [Bacteroidota bacterium]|nr:SDR family NAD(P)-dependent oxidoreductase [Bacteroidota bacterium]